LRDGLIQPSDVEHVAQKGYSLWGKSLRDARKPAELYWDVLYAMAVHGFPRLLIHRLARTAFFRKNIYAFAGAMQWVGRMALRKSRIIDAIVGRPNLPWLYVRDAQRCDTPARASVQPNFGCAPLSVPMRAASDA